MKILLDSDAYSKLMRGHSATAALVREAETIFFSAVVAGELLYGFRSGTQLQQNLEELKAFLDNPYVQFVPVTFVTGDRYSRIFLALRRKGRPIPTNDIWIAAHAMETGADLVSFDNHFREIDALPWVHPEDR